MPARYIIEDHRPHALMMARGSVRGVVSDHAAHTLVGQAYAVANRKMGTDLTQALALLVCPQDRRNGPLLGLDGHQPAGLEC